MSSNHEVTIKTMAGPVWRFQEYTDAADIDEFLSWYSESAYDDIVDIFANRLADIDYVEIDADGDKVVQQPDGTFVGYGGEDCEFGPINAGEMLCAVIYASCASPCCPTTIYFTDGTSVALNGGDDEKEEE